MVSHVLAAGGMSVTGGAVNPTATITALAHRLATHLLDLAARGEAA